MLKLMLWFKRMEHLQLQVEYLKYNTSVFCVNCDGGFSDLPWWCSWRLNVFEMSDRDDFSCSGRFVCLFVCFLVCFLSVLENELWRVSRLCWRVLVIQSPEEWTSVGQSSCLTVDPLNTERWQKHDGSSDTLSGWPVFTVFTDVCVTLCVFLTDSSCFNVRWAASLQKASVVLLTALSNITSTGLCFCFSPLSFVGMREGREDVGDEEAHHFLFLFEWDCTYIDNVTALNYLSQTDKLLCVLLLLEGRGPSQTKIKTRQTSVSSCPPAGTNGRTTLSSYLLIIHKHTHPERPEVEWLHVWNAWLLSPTAQLWHVFK